jgi:hypothetical protein
MITIEAIEGRSEQGVLKPFRCVGDDGKRYFVKGRGAGRASLISEFVAGSLGHLLGLPIPPFAIVNVPPELVRDSVVEGLLELGGGLCFGSERHPYGQEIGRRHLPQISADLARAVLLFDWWVHNSDRSFGGSDGNPNLLWDTAGSGLVVIDHNLAFDPDFDSKAFWQHHVFRSERPILAKTAFRDEWEPRIEFAHATLTSILETVPEEWYYEDPFQTVKSDFDFDAAKQILARFRTNDFWNTVSL